MLPKTVLALAALALSPVEALWPVPVKSSLGDKTLWIDQTVAVTYNGKQLSYTAGYAPPSGRKFESQDIVQGGVARTFEAIFQKGLVPWMISEKGDDWEPATGGGNATRITKLAIEQTKEDDENNFKPLAGDVDESYSLSVGLTGEAKLKANSSIGVLRGLETFSQLFFQHSSGSSWYTQSAPVEIEDAPKYPHRGVLLDVARHWFEVDDIKRTIDGLAMNKMNVLHLHITDTQSWPLEVPALPRLHEVASYRKGMYYSTEEIASIYEYGVHRGVQVIMEIDMPGHVGIEEAYPGLTVAYKERPYQWYCAQPPCGSLKLNDTGVEDFLDTLFDDLLPRIAPYTAYFHTGGDEYKANNSLLDPALETADHEVLQPLLQRFLDHAHAKVREHGLVPFVWEEMVLEWNATLGEDVVIQSWLGNSAIKELAEAGHKVIDSSYEFYWLDFDNGAAFQEFYPFPDWCSPTKSWRLIYSRDPAEGVAPEAIKNVLGGELPVWTETIDPTSLDSIMWPRAGAAGEVWWSGRVDADGVNRTMYDARPRLSEQRERMLKRGVRGHPITQLWCDQNEVEDCAHVP